MHAQVECPAKIGVMRPKAKELPEARIEVWNRSLPRASGEEYGPADKFVVTGYSTHSKLK